MHCLISSRIFPIDPTATMDWSTMCLACRGFGAENSSVQCARSCFMHSHQTLACSGKREEGQKPAFTQHSSNPIRHPFSQSSCKPLKARRSGMPIDRCPFTLCLAHHIAVFVPCFQRWTLAAASWHCVINFNIKASTHQTQCQTHMRASRQQSAQRHDAPVFSTSMV